MYQPGFAVYIPLGRMKKVLLANLAVALIAIFGGCASPIGNESAARPLLLGTWAEIVSSSPANPTDGRQIIERLGNGTFKMIFVKTYPAKQT
jgi:hypothetical protein